MTTSTVSEETNTTINKTVREEWGRLLASLTKTLGDLQLAEDCLQDAVTSALTHWHKNGLPNSPAAWLIQTARRKAIDRLRRAKNFASKQGEIAHLIELDAQASIEDVLESDMTAIPDKRLEMIFTCCHPAIEQKSRLALTLRTIGGLSTEEIASAFLDKTETMAARLTRAKKKIALANIPYAIPAKEMLPERIQSVLGVIYLIFNEGYSASKGDALIRHDLCEEALRLARLIHELLPDEPEPDCLLALILLHDSRRQSRLSKEGQFIALEHQDRSCWNRKTITEGTSHLKTALAKGKAGPYQLQAAISACHAQAKNWQETDWNQISALYELLYAMQSTSVVLLNRAYAISHSKSPAKALNLLQMVADDLSDYQPFHATKADLLKRMGKLENAAQSLQRAIELSTNDTERKHLKNELTKLSLN